MEITQIHSVCSLGTSKYAERKWSTLDCVPTIHTVCSNFVAFLSGEHTNTFHFPECFQSLPGNFLVWDSSLWWRFSTGRVRTLVCQCEIISLSLIMWPLNFCQAFFPPFFNKTFQRPLSTILENYQNYKVCSRLKKSTNRQAFYYLSVAHCRMVQTSDVHLPPIQRWELSSSTSTDLAEVVVCVE